MAAHSPSFNERLAAHRMRLSPAEWRVARFFQENREEVLFASAAALAAKAGTSDATVVRTARALGFGGLEELRRSLAAELRSDLSPAGRMTRTLGEVGDDLHAAFAKTLDVHAAALDRLRHDITPEVFRSAIDRILDARRIVVFGIGPSSAIAAYFVTQLGRFGLEARGIGQTGLLFADQLQSLRKDDLVVILAYGRVYRELAALLDEAGRIGARTILVTDTLAAALRRRVDLVLPVARGRADMLSMHTATIGLIEALLVGIASRRPQQTIASLAALNRLRARLVGEPMNLPAPGPDGRRR